MFLAIYIHRRLGLTLDLTEEHLHLPPDAIREGPAFELLSADPDNLRDPVRLRYWLEAFLPEYDAIAPCRLQARRAWEDHGAGLDRTIAWRGWAISGTADRPPGWRVWRPVTPRLTGT